jgi:hypothetical protein
LLGNQFLKGYYVALNYTGEGHIGFNGPYREIDRYVPPKPPVRPEKPIPPMIIILIIAGIVLFASVIICVCIKKRND